MGVFDGVQSILGQHDLELLVLPCPTSQDPYPYLERFVARNAVDAMILSATTRVDQRIDLLQAREIPFVAIGRSTSGKDYSWIDLDFEGVVNEAVDRFVAQGHRRIAVTVPPGEINFAHVIPESYRRAMRRHRLPIDPNLVVEISWSEQGGYDLAEKIFSFDDPPTAAFVIGEMNAIGLYRRMRELKKQPGRDLAIIAFRDEPAIRVLAPTITMFDLSLHDLGVAVAEAVLAQLPAYRDRYPLGTVQRRWPMALIAGESDGPVAAAKPKSSRRPSA
jgi:DNA-binding LacI/PurR family transcriptional regulator